jgi:hypothetical protein
MDNVTVTIDGMKISGRCGTYPQHPKAVAEAAKVLQGG